MNPECQKISDLDSMTAEQDKIWYADRNPKTNDDGTDVFYSILCWERRTDALVSTLSSFAGQVLIPVPVLGAVVGNTVGTMMYQIAKNNLSSREQKIFEEYVEAVH